MRTATPLNIETQPGVGMGYVIRNIKTRKLVRASTTCQRDIDRKGSKIKALRAFSGEEPFFTVKIGSLHTEIEVLKFLCGVKHKKCRDVTGTYEWTGISLADARKQKMEFAEPGYVTKEDAPVAVKVKKTKTAKVEKKVAVKTPAVKTETAPVAKKPVKGSRSAPKPKPAKVAKTETAPVAPVAPVTEAVAAAPVETVAPAATEQTAAEFESEINKQFEADLAKQPAATATA